METLQVLKENALKAYKEADSSGKKMLVNLFGEKQLYTDITERVKIFEDACAELGLDMAIVENAMADIASWDTKVEAFAKLKIVVSALNEGWNPNWDDANQPKYYPWFKKVAGSGFRCHGCGYDRTAASVGSRLVFKTKQLAEYAGRQFEALYNQFIS